MIDAMQITVSNDIENRIEDSSSTEARHTFEPLVNSMPSEETVMKKGVIDSKKKAVHLPMAPPHWD